jgi:hypothetical protein
VLKVTVAPTQFYQDEIAVPLIFTVTNLDGTPRDVTYATFTLVADGVEYALDPTGNPGELTYVTVGGEFTTIYPTKRISCYIREENDPYGDETFLSDEFPMYVVLKPTENL